MMKLRTNRDLNLISHGTQNSMQTVRQERIEALANSIRVSRNISRVLNVVTSRRRRDHVRVIDGGWRLAGDVFALLVDCFGTVVRRVSSRGRVSTFRADERRTYRDAECIRVYR